MGGGGRYESTEQGRLGQCGIVHGRLVHSFVHLFIGGEDESLLPVRILLQV